MIEIYFNAEPLRIQNNAELISLYTVNRSQIAFGNDTGKDIVFASSAPFAFSIKS